MKTRCLYCGHEKPYEYADATGVKSLTKRERAVITLVAEGLQNKEIAARLFITDTTVSHHLTSIFTKLGLSDRVRLVIYAFAHGLAVVPS